MADLSEESILSVERRDIPCRLLRRTFQPAAPQPLGPARQGVSAGLLRGRRLGQGLRDRSGDVRRVSKGPGGVEHPQFHRPDQLPLLRAAAHGIMQICDNKAHLGELYRLGEEVVGYESSKECVDLTRYSSAHSPGAAADRMPQAWKRWKRLHAGPGLAAAGGDRGELPGRRANGTSGRSGCWGHSKTPRGPSRQAEPRRTSSNGDSANPASCDSRRASGRLAIPPAMAVRALETWIVGCHAFTRLRGKACASSETGLSTRARKSCVSVWPHLLPADEGEAPFSAGNTFALA